MRLGPATPSLVGPSPLRPRGLPVRCGESSGRMRLTAVTGSTAAGSTTSIAAKTGTSRLNGLAAEVASRTVSRPASASSPACVFARVGPKLGLALRASR